MGFSIRGRPSSYRHSPLFVLRYVGIQIRPYAYITFDNLDGSFVLSVSLGSTHQLYVVWNLHLVLSGMATTDPSLVSSLHWPRPYANRNLWRSSGRHNSRG